jgi:hypothetical protein
VPFMVSTMSVTSRPSSTTVGSLLRPGAFSAPRLSFAYPSPQPRVSGALCYLQRFGSDVAPCGGITMRPPSPRIPAKEFQVTSPIRVVAALGFRQYAAVGLYPTHVLLESNEGGFCTARKIAAYRHCLRISRYGVSWLSLLSTRRAILE